MPAVETQWCRGIGFELANDDPLPAVSAWLRRNQLGKSVCRGHEQFRAFVVQDVTDICRLKYKIEREEPRSGHRRERRLRCPRLPRGYQPGGKTRLESRKTHTPPVLSMVNRSVSGIFSSGHSPIPARPSCACIASRSTATALYDSFVEMTRCTPRTYGVRSE